MREQMILFDGEPALSNFYSDLSQVMDHSYHVDELFTFYSDWRQNGRLFVDYYVAKIYPVIPQTAQEDQEEAKENQAALRNAMVNLYCALDKMMSGAEIKRTVVHAAHCPIQQVVVITVR